MKAGYGRILLAVCLMFCIIPFLFPLGKKEWNTTAKHEPPKASVKDPQAPLQKESGFYDRAVTGQTVEITGTVRLIGSDPFPEMIVSETDQHDWYIPDAGDRKILSAYEQRTVTISGTVTLKDMVMANGEKIGVRRILTNITLIK